MLIFNLFFIYDKMDFNNIIFLKIKLGIGDWAQFPIDIF